MFWSGSLLWICLALCVATGGSETFYRRSGQEVVMDCGDVVQSKTRDVEWRHNNVLVIRIISKSGNSARGTTPLSKRVKLDDVKLKIPAVEFGDAGEYICSGNNAGGYKVTRQHTLKMVSVSVSPAESVLIYTDVTLRCEVVGDSAAQVQWMKPPDTKPYGNSDNTVTLKPVTSNDAGQWTCVIKDSGKVVERFDQSITVVGPLTSLEEVTAPAGSNAQLPCILNNTGKLQIEGGYWSHEGSHLVNLSSKGSVEWSRTASKFKVVKKPPTTDFSITLQKVDKADAGTYVCSFTFQHAGSLQAVLELKVVGDASAAAAGSGPPGSGVALWVWVAVAAACVLLLVLAVVIALIHRRNKYMKRKVRKVKSMRQPLTNRNYCQCERPARQPRPAGRGERPPPLPRYQYNEL